MEGTKDQDGSAVLRVVETGCEVSDASSGNSPAGGRAPSSGSPPSRAAPRPAYAALDLGTNNCRLLVARPSRRGFKVIDAFSRIVRLGEGLHHSGRLSHSDQSGPCPLRPDVHHLPVRRERCSPA